MLSLIKDYLFYAKNKSNSATVHTHSHMHIHYQRIYIFKV